MLRGFNGLYLKDKHHPNRWNRQGLVYLGIYIRPTSIIKTDDGWKLVATDLNQTFFKSKELLGYWTGDSISVTKEQNLKTWFHTNSGFVYPAVALAGVISFFLLPSLF
jgi:hypothetical protein